MPGCAVTCSATPSRGSTAATATWSARRCGSTSRTRRRSSISTGSTTTATSTCRSTECRNTGIMVGEGSASMWSRPLVPVLDPAAPARRRAASHRDGLVTKPWSVVRGVPTKLRWSGNGSSYDRRCRCRRRTPTGPRARVAGPPQVRQMWSSGPWLYEFQAAAGAAISHRAPEPIAPARGEPRRIDSPVGRCGRSASGRSGVGDQPCAASQRW